MDDNFSKTITWTEGYRDYKKVTFTINQPGEQHYYHMELCDVEPMGLDNIHDIFAEHVSVRQTKFVEVLFSGGLDSECVVRSMLEKKIPVKAITLKLMLNGYCINTHDMYYSEKFCRENNVEHKILELDGKKWIESGRYLDYLKPYLISSPHVSAKLWLIEQTTGFPVMGGDYTWPWVFKSCLSPHRSTYSQFNRWMKDHGVHGIGSMIGHSIDSNSKFIRAHVDSFTDEHKKPGMIPVLKKQILEKLGYENVEMRLRHMGWEQVVFLPTPIFDVRIYKDKLEKEFGPVDNRITWNTLIAEAMRGTPGTNNTFD